jgi:hypothetical protein
LSRHLGGLERVLGASPVAGALWLGLVLTLLLLAALV